jgi:hypothetical protein
MIVARGVIVEGKERDNTMIVFVSINKLICSSLHTHLAMRRAPPVTRSASTPRT